MYATAEAMGTISNIEISIKDIMHSIGEIKALREARFNFMESHELDDTHFHIHHAASFFERLLKDAKQDIEWRQKGVED